MHLVKKINYIKGYKISLTFNDRKTKIVDVEPYLDKGIFLALRDPNYFNQVTLSGNTIVWPNEADFCPDVLYEIGEDINEEKTPIKQQGRLKGKKAEIKYQMSYAFTTRKRKKKE